MAAGAGDTTRGCIMAAGVTLGTLLMFPDGGNDVSRDMIVTDCTELTVPRATITARRPASPAPRWPSG